MAKRKYIVGWVLAALLVALNISSVGATVPDAVNPNLPVAAGAGGGVGVNGGTAGLSRSTIQNPVFTGVNTNVSAIPSANGNETAALYRPGGTYLITFEETQAQTVSTSRYSFGNGARSTGGDTAFSFTGNIVRVSSSTLGTFNLLYTTNSGQLGNTAAVGSTVTIGGTIQAPNNTFVAGARVTIVSRTAVNGVLPQGFYIVRDAQTIGFANNGSANLPANSVINVGFDGNQQVYNSSGTAVYNTVLVRPPTFNPPNGTSTGEPTAADVVNPFTTTGKVSVFIGNGYANPPGSQNGGAPFFSRPPQSQP